MNVHSEKARSVLALCTVALTVFLGAPINHASARPRKGKAIVFEFEGRGASRLRKDVVRILRRRGIRSVSQRQVEGAVRRTGAPAESVEVASELKVSVLVEGRVERRGRRHCLNLVVRNAADGFTLGDADFCSRKLRRISTSIKRRRGRALWNRLGEAFASGDVPRVQRLSNDSDSFGDSQSEDEDPPLLAGTGDDEIPGRRCRRTGRGRSAFDPVRDGPQPA